MFVRGDKSWQKIDTQVVSWYDYRGQGNCQIILSKCDTSSVSERRAKLNEKENDYFSLPVVAKVLNVSLPTVYGWVKKGYLNTTKVMCKRNGREMSVVLKRDVYDFKNGLMKAVYHYSPRKKKERGIIVRLLEWFRNAI